jgi:hypothetical protein
VPALLATIALCGRAASYAIRRENAPFCKLIENDPRFALHHNRGLYSESLDKPSRRESYSFHRTAPPRSPTLWSGVRPSTQPRPDPSRRARGGVAMEIILLTHRSHQVLRQGSPSSPPPAARAPREVPCRGSSRVGLASSGACSPSDYWAVIVPSSVSIVTSPTLTSSGAWIVTPPASIFSGISTGESVSTITPEPQPTRAAVESAMSKIANFLTLLSFLEGYLRAASHRSLIIRPTTLKVAVSQAVRGRVGGAHTSKRLLEEGH